MAEKKEKVADKKAERRILTPSELALAESFASRYETRHNLTAIHVTDEYTEATDGYVLGRVSKSAIVPETFPVMPGVPETGFDEPLNVLLSAEKVRKLKIPKSKSMPILENACLSNNGKKGILAVTDLENTQTTTAEEDGDFPSTDSIIPTAKEDDITIRVDAKILKQIVDFVVKHGKESITKSGGTSQKGCPFLVRIPKSHAGTTPLLLEFETKEEQKGIALIMPIRKD